MQLDSFTQTMDNPYMSTYTVPPQTSDETWIRRRFHHIMSRPATNLTAAGGKRRVHAPGRRMWLGIEMTAPLCGSATATGPLSMKATHKTVDCGVCLRMTGNRNNVEPVLF